MNIKTILTVTLAVLFVMAAAYQVFAFSAVGGAPYTYTGTITSLDKDYRWISVQANPNSEMSFAVADGAEVMKCSMDEHFGDLKVGDQITVTYFESGSSGFIANSLDLLPAGEERC